MKKLIPVIGLALAAIAGTATTVAQGKTSSSKASAAGLRLAPRSEDVRAVGNAGSPGVRRRLQEGRRLVRDQQRQRRRAEAEDRRPISASPNGAKVVILTSLDAGSSLTIEKAATAAGAKVDRVRPAGHRRQALDLHLLRRRVGRRVAGQGRGRGPEGQRYVRQEAGRRRAERRPEDATRPSSRAVTSDLKPLYKNGTFKKGRSSSSPTGTTRRPARSSSRCSSRRATRSTASRRRMTVSPTRWSSRSRRTSSSRSR